MSGSDRRALPCGSWPSPISARSLVAGVTGFSELDVAGENLVWIESRPEEAGRSTLMMQERGSIRELTPAPCNVRSRVHEYGGGASLATADRVFFVDFADQNLYAAATREPAGVVQITHSDAGTRFADFILDAPRNRLISVVETHHEDREPENCLAAIDLHSGELTRIATGHDFYAAPRLSPGGGRLAYLAWDHPNMPWDGTVLLITEFDDDGMPGPTATVAGGAGESVLQPGWQSDDALLYLSDANGFWNLYRYDHSGIYCVLEDGADYADPPWVFGQKNYALADDRHVLITRLVDRGQELVLVNTDTTMASPFLGDEAPWLRYGSLCVAGEHLCFIGSSGEVSPRIERLPLKDGEALTVKSSAGPRVDPEDLSKVEAIRFPTRDGFEAHGCFYPPASSTCRAPEGERPPLLVLSHGGPTAATDGALRLPIQYYTSRGWAVLDVNYRGSSGHGREYRTALNGRWGLVDVTDCEDGVRYLARAARIDPDRVAISGGSAGGFTTLAALTSTDCFRAGASHYGIGDLNALARDTHKFESRYLDTLLGDPTALTERSPINHLDRFRCPAIFFQGSEDKVVPPNQSRAMADALRSRGVPVAYLEFSGEGHGFRDAENIVRAVEAQYAFFCRVFGIEPADALPSIEIDNEKSLQESNR